jgi:hypothetical protein
MRRDGGEGDARRAAQAGNEDQEAACHERTGEAVRAVTRSLDMVNRCIAAEAYVGRRLSTTVHKAAAEVTKKSP